VTNQPANDPEDRAPERLEPPDPAQRFGKAAADDADLADRLERETEGDLGDAEAAFDDAKRGPVPTAAAPPDDRE
jgi:hypothetical protein